MDRLQGRVAVVTGASSGIGEALAVQLVEAGMIVVAVARREQRLQDIAERTADAAGKLHPYAADVSKTDDVAKLFEWVDETLGGIAVMVNNAAVLPLQGPADLSPDEVKDIVNTNVIAVMQCCGETIKNMKKHDVKDGHIVNMNSILGHGVYKGGEASTSIYTGTKHAITGFARALRFDVQKLDGFRIRITSICPGRVSTDMINPYLPESMQEIMLQPEHVADAVVYAISCPPSVEISEVIIRCPAEEI